MIRFSRILFLKFILILLYPGSISAQNQEFAKCGPKGIYLFLSKEVPCGITTSAYRIERRENSGTWKPVTDVKTPATFLLFQAEINKAQALLPLPGTPPLDELNSKYNKAVRHGTLDSIGGWNNGFPVRIALGTMFYDSDVKAGKKYQYKVTQLNSAGLQKNTLISPEITFNTGAEFNPMQLSNLSADDKMLMIRWFAKGTHPASHARTFYYNNKTPREAPGILAQYKSSDTTWYVYYDSTAMIAPGTERQFFIVPFDAFGNTGTSSSIAIAKNNNANRSAFMYINSDLIKDSKAISVRWRFSHPQTIVSFTLYRSKKPDADFVKLITLRPIDTVYVDNNLEIDKVYYYYLTADPLPGGISKKSSIVFGVGYDPDKPIAPFIQGAVATKKGVKLIVDVTDVDASGIKIFRNNGITESLEQISGLIRKADSVRIVCYDSSSNLSGKLTYTYAVKTESKSYILSDFSNRVPVRPMNHIPPPNPEYFRAYEEDGAAILHWDNLQLNDPSIHGFIVSRKMDKTGSKTEDPFVIIAGDKLAWQSNSFIDSTVLAGNTYIYKVETIDFDGNRSLAGSLVTVSLQPDLPIAPASITASRIPNGVHLEWSETYYKSMTAYKLYRYQRGSEPVLLKSVNAGIIEYDDLTALSGKLYFYFLTTFNKLGKESKRSSEVGITP